MISNINNIIQISAGDHHSLLLNNKGKVYSFGMGVRYQLGTSDCGYIEIPTVIEELENIIQISAGMTFSFSIEQQGTSLFLRNYRIWTIYDRTQNSHND